MLIFFWIISSFHLFLFVLSEKSNHTCLLPFVTKPCINDGKYLLCTFSLNSFERSLTCNFTSRSLIFTTSDIELFVIPQYYHQFLQTEKIVIEKLIIEPNLRNYTYEYLYWPDFRILSIEIPIDIGVFIIIHDKDILDISRIRNNLNEKEYWHLQIWPGKSGECERTVLTKYNITTTLYKCIYYNEYLGYELCGLRYACLGRYPCCNTGYRRIVCQVYTTYPEIKFTAFNNVSQYETIFINILPGSSSLLHTIEQKPFIIGYNNDKPKYITKRLIMIMSTGFLQMSSKLFDNSEIFQVRIEHDKCNKRQFMLYTIDTIKYSLMENFVDYTSSQTRAFGCWFNTNE